jgi:hypothetical protein
MEISSYPSGKRVFRIDDECYIIYLGSGSDDIKPFLRIGNSILLSDRNIIANIFNIVITESYTGNPAYESSNLNISDLQSNRYVGENSTVDTLLKYLDNYDINAQSIPHSHDVKTGDHRAMLYMYDNGNLTLSYNKDVLFNLHNVEKKDQHFIVKTGWMKDRLSKNSLRYIPDYFKQPGFSIADNSLFLHHKEATIVFDAPDNYFFSLARCGLDPDSITTIVTNEASAGLFELCKRKKHNKKILNVLSTNTSMLKSALELFTTKKPDPLKVKLGALSDLTSGTAAGFKVQSKEKQYIITKSNFPGIIISDRTGSDDDKHIYINPKNNLCRLPYRKKTGSIKLADGIPSTVLAGSPDKEVLIDNYFQGITNLFKHSSDDLSISFSELIVKFFDTVATGGDPGKTLIKIKKGIKKIGSLTENPIIFLINNAREASVYYTQDISENNQQNKAVIKSVRDLGNRMNKLLSSVDKIKVHQPIIGDCYVDEKGSYLFYRTVKKVISGGEYLRYDEIKKTLMDRKNEDTALFNLEIQQLYALISKLETEAATSKKTAKKSKKTAGLAGLKKEAEPLAKPRLKQEREKAVTQKKEPEQAAEQEEKEKPSQTSPAMDEKEKKPSAFKGLPVLKIIIPLAVIVILAVILFLPPLALLNKSYTRRTTRDEKVIAESIEDQKAATETKTGTDAVDAGKDGEDAKPDEKEKGSIKAGDLETDPEKLEAFLSLGYIQLTILDVYKLANKIAVANGYHELDGVEQLGKDPDWIYPGNVFELPDKSIYTVVKGDTVWHITKRFIQKNVDRDWARYQQIMKEVTEGNKNELIAELKALLANLYSENFSKEINNALNELK